MGSRTGVIGLTTVGNLVVRTFSSIILTRLLSPSDFGIVGIITAIFVAVAMLTDLGFMDFLVRHERTEDRHFRDVIWTIHVKRGIAVFAALALSSPVIAWALNKPAIALSLATASSIFALNGLSSLSLLTALRHDKSRQLSILEFSLQVFQTATCILLAFWWRNAWSIIAAMILQIGLRTLLSYWLFPDPTHRLARDPAISSEFTKFSRFVMMSSTLTLIVSQSDKVVLGRLLTLSDFGLYSIALTIASAPMSFAESYVSRIVYPICSRTWREAREDLSTVYYQVRRLPAALYAFACGGLLGSADLVIALLYQPRYSAAASLLSLLMISTALRLPNFAAAQVLVAAGQVSKNVHVTIVRLVWVVAAMPLGFVFFGPIGVVAAVGTVEVPTTIYSWLLLKRLGILHLNEELSFIGLVGAGALIGWLGTWQILHLFPNL